MSAIAEGTHIRFFSIPTAGKTSAWSVESKHGRDGLGIIKWFGPWRKYAFFPEPDTVFEEVCMREISQFIVDQTAEHKLARKAAS
jgi:hypothetical protein